jgi:4-amino-4-deoxy-L-arabinose transferase-like glycosyltransferase
MDLGIAAQSAERRRLALATLATLVAVAAATINLVGYVGAGSDDEHYLQAARCWVAHGVPCVPASHWWTRWPVVAPIAAFTGLLGESRFSVNLGPGLWWALVLAMTGWLGNAWFGWRAGAIAIVLLGSTPMVAASAFEPNIDLPELAFQMAALATATVACRRQSPATAFAAGVLAACALQARETSLLFLAASACAWLAAPRQKRLVLLWAVGGLACAEAAEMLVYALGTGDPLMRLRLAMGHTNIPTTELPTGFHSDRGPLLNPDFMRSWKREAQVTLWWPMDPWINLLASPRTAMLMGSGILALGVLGRWLSVRDRRNALLLLCGAASIALGLVYVLAVDPKPRMFMSLYAALSLTAGAAIAAALRTEAKPLAIMLMLVPAAMGLHVMSQYPASATAEARARQWIGRYGRDVELDGGAASYLTLLPQARALDPRGSGRRYLVATSAVQCERLIDHRHGRPKGRVVDSISGTNPKQGYLCLFEYLPVRRSVIMAGDGPSTT